MELMNLLARGPRRCRHREQTYDHGRGEGGGLDEGRQQHGHT